MHHVRIGWTKFAIAQYGPSLLRSKGAEISELLTRGHNFSALITTRNMSRFKVYLTRPMPDEILHVLRETCDVTSWAGPDPVPKEELIKNIKDKDGLFCLLTDKIDNPVLEAASKLKVIATMSVGFDHLDLPEIKKKGIQVGYTPDVLTDATSELTIGLLLATSRRLMEASAEVKKGGWKAWSPFWMCGHGLKGSTVGIVGFGRVGQKVASMLKPFGVSKILYYNRSAKEKEAEELEAKRASFDELLEKSDFVIVACSYTEKSKDLFNDSAFRKMKNTAIFINTSRGGVVDQDALVRALENKVIAAAGLDVMTPEPLNLDSPLLKLKNCVLLPHIGSATISTRNEMALLTAHNLIAGLKGEVMPAALNF